MRVLVVEDHEAMADVLVSVAATELTAARVLDLGAGTGTAARAARRAGARWIVGVDVVVVEVELALQQLADGHAVLRCVAFAARSSLRPRN